MKGQWTALSENIKSSKRKKGEEKMKWLVIAIFVVFELVRIVSQFNGPFFDEAIYLTAGLRTLEGHGYTDGFLTWFAGSLLWSVLAAIGYKVAGLVGARIVALIFATIAFIAVTQTAQNLFGQKAGFWTATTFATSGPFLALAHLGVLDTLALVGIASSFWAATKLAKKDNRCWLVFVSVAFTIGMIAKYPMGLMLIPIVGIVLVLRREKAVMDVVILGFISLAISIAFYLPWREQVSQLFSWRLANKPTFGSTSTTIRYVLLYFSLAPFLLSLVGWFVAKDKRALASVLLLSLTIWPAYHILSGDPVSASKHVVFGYLFAYPLIGLTLSKIWEHRKGKVVAIATILALTVFGFVQLDRLDRSWPDIRGIASYLTDHVQPGEQLLISDSWPYTMYLYDEGQINSPWDVFDVYRITHGESEIGLCQYNWFIDRQGSYSWPENVRSAITQCDGFQQVFSATSWVVGLDPKLEFVTYPVHTTVWRNTSKR